VLFSISGKKRSILPSSRSNNGLGYLNISIITPKNGDVEEKRPQTSAVRYAAKLEDVPLKIPPRTTHLNSKPCGE
jgi:hypothetical protein